MRINQRLKRKQMIRYAVAHGIAPISCILILLAALAGCIPTTGGAVTVRKEAQTGKLASVMQNGILVIATDPDYAPQSEFIDWMPRESKSKCAQNQYTANQWSGFDVEVAIEIARRLEVEPCFVSPAWSQVIAGDWNDRWDINVGSMVITPDRMQNVYFTQPYISGQAVIFVNKENKTYQHLEDLSGKRIGVCSGCAYESYLRGSLVIPGEKIDHVIENAVPIGYSSDSSALEDLAAGDGVYLDAVMTDPDTGKNAVNEGFAVRQLKDVVYHDYSGVAIDKKSIRDPIPLVRRLTEIIQEMHTDGTLVKLSKKYYGGDFTTPAANFDISALEQIP